MHTGPEAASSPGEGGVQARTTTECTSDLVKVLDWIFPFVYIDREKKPFSLVDTEEELFVYQATKKKSFSILNLEDAVCSVLCIIMKFLSVY